MAVISTCDVRHLNADGSAERSQWANSAARAMVKAISPAAMSSTTIEVRSVGCCLRYVLT
jgi:hypothetical protein